jgi:hypothetical protein
MPWHMVQFLRITCQTGPSGRVTWGRAGRRPICAAAGGANAAATTLRIAKLLFMPAFRNGTSTLC